MKMKIKWRAMQVLYEYDRNSFVSGSSFGMTVTTTDLAYPLPVLPTSFVSMLGDPVDNKIDNRLFDS